MKEQSKKLLFVLIGLALFFALSGIFYWQENKKPALDTKTAPINPSPSATSKIPKVTSYQVPILMYHYIRDASGESEMGKNLSVNPKNFESHLKWLKDNGYEALKVADLVDPDKKALSEIIFNKKKPVAITFDDGYLDAYTNAFPILKKYQMTATFYIIRGYEGKAEYMNRNQIDELKKAGMEIGSHTLSHPNLTKISEEEAKNQIFSSKEDAVTFCYPAGKYDSTTLRLVQEAGYNAAVTTHFGIADETSSILELPRVRVEEGSGEVLGDKISAALEIGSN